MHPVKQLCTVLVVACLAAGAKARTLSQDEPPTPSPLESRAAQVRREAALHLRLSVNDVNQGHFEEALKDLQALIRVELANPIAYYLLGVCHLELGHYREALDAFTTVTEIDPRDADAYHGVGLVHIRQQDWEAALRACLRALRVNKKHVRVWNDLGIAYAHLGRYSKAIAAFRAAAELDPDQGEALANSVMLHLRLGDRREAAELIERRLAADPDNPAALAVGAALYRQQGDGPKAAILEARLDSLSLAKRKVAETLGDLSDLQRADQPADSGEKLRLARALLERGLPVQALELLPPSQSGEIAAMRGQTLFSMGRYQDAAEAFGAVGDGAAPAPLHYDRGLALELAGEPAAAMQQLRAALEFDPTFAPALYRLGSLYLDQKKFDEALKVFQELVDRAPNHVLAEPAARRVAELRQKLGR